VNFPTSSEVFGDSGVDGRKKEGVKETGTYRILIRPPPTSSQVDLMIVVKPASLTQTTKFGRRRQEQM